MHDSYDSLPLMHGEAVDPAPFSNARFVAKGIPCDVVGGHQCYGAELISQTLAEAAQSIDSAGLQAIPVCVDHRDGCILGAYSLLNITRHIKCLDLKRSIVREGNDGALTAVSKYVIQSTAIPSDAGFFRVAEFPYSIMVANWAVKMLVACGSVKGMALIGVEAS
ncbi:hypothetical protein LOC67_24565 [Stieleria sp. JC731]|uniref:imm11 family protein n=1 Tax=Pirellulaceae TaxID=2691357 RepID=UPI001E3083D7|nr:DUF1629 domain-containing protein [Stieleria sp. JC731]MCC9603736.1 hypothetical protein [Stieleria sp. JC731]